MYAYKDDAGRWVGPVNMTRRFRDCNNFHELTDDERRAMGWYPCVVVNYTVPYGKTRSKNPEFEFDGDVVKATYAMWDTPRSELMKYIESVVDAHIDAVVRKFGYDSSDSIAKYICTSNSPFKAECMALAEWIDKCWLKCYELLNEDKLYTPNQVLTQLPEFKHPDTT
jgi:hypothetical protein